MSLGRNREEQELTKLLAATLVQREVMDPMERIGWSHSAPPAPGSGQPAAEGAPAAPVQPAPAAPVSGQPAQPAPATPAAPAAKADNPSGFEFNLEDFKNPITGKYFDKYDSPAEAMKGLGHLANMAKTAFADRESARDEATRLSTELARLRSTPSGNPPDAPTPTLPAATRAEVDKAQEALDMVLSQIAEDGGVLDGDHAKRLSAAQRELSRAEAKFAVVESRDQERRASDSENARWSKVNEYMEAKYPKSNQFATEIGLHVQSDPLLSKAIAAMVSQGSEIEASELAWLSYERAVLMNSNTETHAKAAETEADLAAREQVRNEHLARARKDAGIVTGAPGGAGIHQNPGMATSQEQIEHLAQQMKREGETPGSRSAAAWRHAVIGRHLDPAIFGPN